MVRCHGLFQKMRKADKYFGLSRVTNVLLRFLNPVDLVNLRCQKFGD